MKNFSILASALLAALTISGCKSQKTLSEAVTVADPASEVTEVAPIQYTTPQKKTTTPAPAAQTHNDRTEHVKVVDKGDSGKLKSFCVIVGSFGSKANAEAQRDKMKGRGYHSFIVQNTKGMFRVVAASFSNRDDATSVRDVIRSSYANETGTCAEAWLLVPEEGEAE